MLNTFFVLLSWNVSVVAILAVIVAAIGCIPAIQRRPALRHSLCLLVLIKLITPPLIPVPVLGVAGDGSNEALVMTDRGPTTASVIEGPSIASPFPGSGEETSIGESTTTPHATDAAEALAAADAASSHSAATWSLTKLLLLAAGVVWGVVTLGLLVRGAARVRRLSLLVRCADGGSERLKRLSIAAAARMGVTRIAVREVRGNVPPVVWSGWKGPVIVFPTELTRHMDDEQITCIVCHELAHIVRRDQWSNTFAMLVAALFWWHPAAWFAWREMRKTQELCADEAVIQVCDVRRRSYLETLLQAVDFLQMKPGISVAPASGLFEQHSLETRFRMIADGELVHRNRWWTSGMIILGLAILMCLPVNAQVSDNLTPNETPPHHDSHVEPASADVGNAHKSLDDESVIKPLFLHWLSLTHSGDQVKPELLLTTKVSPGTEFDLIIADSKSPIREHWIGGSITSQDESSFVARVDCLWRSPEEFSGKLKLDEPVDAASFLWNGEYFPTRIVLSRESSAKSFLISEPRWTGEFKTETSPLRVAAIRPSNYANELAMSAGNSLGNWLSSQVYDPANPKEQDKNRILAIEAIADMMSQDSRRITWRLDGAAEKNELTSIAEHTARFVMDLGDGNKWDENVTLKYSLRGSPKLRRFEIRSTVSPAVSYVHIEFSVSHPDGQRKGKIAAMTPVRSAYYSRGVVRSDGTWPQAFELIKTKPLDLSSAAASDER